MLKVYLKVQVLQIYKTFEIKTKKIKHPKLEMQLMRRHSNMLFKLVKEFHIVDLL